MARYIDADKIHYPVDKRETGKTDWHRGVLYMKDTIDRQPTADVAEIKHGEWKWGEGLGGQYGIWCTNCGSGWVDSENAEWIAREHDYCGKCGAIMAGGKAMADGH